MTPFEQIRQDILQLPHEEKEILVHILLDDLDENRAESQDEINSAWNAEIERRIADVEGGPVSMVPVEDVFREQKGTPT